MPGLLPELLRIPRGSVVHLHVSQAFLPEMVNIAHHLRRLPYVAHVHIDVGPAERAGLLVRAYKALVLGRVLRAAAIVVVFTEEQRLSVASNYDVPLSRIVVVPNGVDGAFFHNDHRVLHPKPRLLYVGRLSSEKNLPLLLQALDGVSEQFETTLVGDGELDAALREAAARRGLQNVRFYGRAQGAELRELYRQADAFVLPSEREGMPLVLIIATDIPGTREIVRHGENGILVPLGNPRALRQALLDVTGDPELYRKMSDRSRHLADSYSWELVSAEFERFYARLRR
jgi:glycosyltransferase involved in cell wall biosynthesis